MNPLKKLLAGKIGAAAYSLLLAGILAFMQQPAATEALLKAGAAGTAFSNGAMVCAAGTEALDATAYDFTVAFAGDINLDESWATTQHLNAAPNGIYDCISPELISQMQQADLMCLNNEFTYSTRGTPISGKAYTFRAAPERVEVLKTLGVDVVTLANNHIFDYGEAAFYDTLDTLDGAGIAHMGAGRNLEEAMTPVYKQVDGKTVAFVAASRAEKNILTPEASGTSPGILRCYNTARFKEVIQEAKQNADFVIAYVHWGTEYSAWTEAVQRSSGREYLESGADVVIGAHSHCLQGMEYYNGKPILYSLGNYWFNDKTLDTALVKLRFYGDSVQGSHLQVQVVPAVQSGCETRIASEESEKNRILDYLESISYNVAFNEQGILYEK
jgi:poly-gamma-glutamate synthesis protein (capsule biosynthesis protein)